MKDEDVTDKALMKHSTHLHKYKLFLQYLQMIIKLGLHSTSSHIYGSPDFYLIVYLTKINPARCLPLKDSSLTCLHHVDLQHEDNQPFRKIGIKPI